MSKTFHEMLVEALPRLRAYAIVLTNDRTLAEDLLQETAMRALSARTQFTMGTNFSAWLFCILRNQFLSWARKNHRRTVPIDNLPEAFLAYMPPQDDKVLVHELARVLGKIPRDQREALALTCGNGLRYEEAAKVMGCSIGTVKSRVWRARAKLENFALGEPEGQKTGERPRALPAAARTARPEQRATI